ncbi:MAG: deoxynucleoside kinase [Bacteroidetes bacterium]|nr:deoxynucleoside kinase [Bacteroidota bacterium]MCH8523316.1 deoxynucleoside kinase [Balneolales bacterium]
MNTYDFIAVEGVIGAGKTSLANLLAKRHNARLVLEEFEDNPFLPKFYEDRARYAFQTQLAFLASRFHQQKNMTSRDLFSDLLISDYLFDKDRIFARLNLNDDELALYDRIYGIMSTIAAKPDLVIFIQCSVDRLLQNIDKRGRSYEKDISPDYLSELNDAYNHFFHHYDRSPLLVINASEIDFVHNEDQLRYIEEQIFNTPIRNQKTYITPR